MGFRFLHVFLNYFEQCFSFLLVFSCFASVALEFVYTFKSTIFIVLIDDGQYGLV